MSAAKTDREAGLRPVYPNRVAYGDHELVIGGLGYALLSRVIAVGGRAALGELARLVWGAAAVPQNRIEAMCSRLSRRLQAAGYPGRMGVDRGYVVLYA